MGHFRPHRNFFFCLAWPNNIQPGNCSGRKIKALNGDRHNINCAIDHMLEAEKNGEINEKHVTHIVENINVAGKDYFPRLHDLVTIIFCLVDWIILMIKLSWQCS